MIFLHNHAAQNLMFQEDGLMKETNRTANDYKNYAYSVADTIVSTKLKRLYVNPGWCVTADLYRDDEGHLYVFWYWLTNHGIGPDHRSCVVESVEELRACLLEDADSWVTEEKVNELCRECEIFFE